MTKSLIQRFEDKYFIEPNSGCWIWTAKLEKTGYGRMKIARKSYYAHRISYELFVGKIPDGLQLDHLCRTRSCVNPKHLEPVAPRTNIIRGLTGATTKARHARKTHCAKGHELSGSNVRLEVSQGWQRRVCVTCANERNRQYRARQCSK